MAGRISFKQQMREYVSSIPSGVEFRASEIAKRFNFPAADAASKQIGLLPNVKKLDKGVFVKE